MSCATAIPRHVLFIALVLWISIASSFAAASSEERAPPAETNKLWRGDLFFEWAPPIRWSTEEVRLVEEISNILSRSRAPRSNTSSMSASVATVSTPLRNRNTAIARIGIIVEAAGNRKELVWYALPFVFESHLYSFLRNPELKDESHQDLTDIQTALNRLCSGYYNNLMGISDFLSPYPLAIPARGVAQKVAEKMRDHYREKLREHLEVVTGKRYVDTGPFYHSEQGMIAALMNPAFLRRITERYIDLADTNIRGIMLDVLSYYSACDNCTNTLALLPTFKPLLDQLKAVFRIDPSSSFNFWITESSLHPLDPVREKAQQEEQAATMGMPIGSPEDPPGKIYHRVPLLNE